MKLVTVTLTGLDASVDPWSVITLYERFPFVEFGVLFSKDRQGKENRYPSKEWINQLGNVTRFFREERKKSFPLAAHLCGSYAREVVEYIDRGFTDTCSWETEFSYSCHFDRIQLNMSDELFKRVSPEDIESLLEDKGVILQSHHGFDHGLPGYCMRGGFNKSDPMRSKLSILFDVSGGTGMLPLGWAEADESFFCGYAGGLKPENLEEELKKIEGVAGNANIWIDMESGIRENDLFSMEKAEKVLEIAAPWVANGGK